MWRKWECCKDSFHQHSRGSWISVLHLVKNISGLKCWSSSCMLGFSLRVMWWILAHWLPGVLPCLALQASSKDALSNMPNYNESCKISSGETISFVQRRSECQGQLLGHKKGHEHGTWKVYLCDIEKKPDQDREEQKMMTILWHCLAASGSFLW